MERSENIIKNQPLSTMLHPRVSYYPSLSDITEKLEDDRKSLNQQKRISFFNSCLISAALEDTLIQLRCLEKCNNELKIIKTMADINYLKTLKFGVKPMIILNDCVEMSKQELNSTIKKVEKLDSDRKQTNCVIESAYLELALSGTFDSLKEANNAFTSLEAYRNDLQIDEARNKVIRKDMWKQVRQQRNHIKSMIYDTETTIEELRTKLEDSVLLSETCCRYVDNWQVARTEQHDQTIANTEICPITTINYYKQRSEHELRVHNEVELLVTIVINETLEKVEFWMEKYDRDMEKIDLKIQKKKMEYHDMLNKRIQMEEQLKKRDQLIKDWIKFKDDREKARLYHEKMTNAATAVQAWWRGLIVRLKLGPFKETKKGKGKKK